MSTSEEDLADVRARIEIFEEQLTSLDDQLGSVCGRVDGLEEQSLGSPAPRQPRVFPTLAEWVDHVYSRLAARHEPVWCTSWTDHDEAVRRLKNLWDTWEQANVCDDPRELDNWMRERFDHHATLLHANDGTFRACKPGQRCNAPTPLGALREPAVVTYIRPARQGGHP